tara:strand:+ start:302 stop:490 length:189 start_codon:yes stop_codon:yes gene_type:complete
VIHIKNSPVNPAYLGGVLIVAVMFLAVFIGGANAGDCPRINSAKATSVEAHHKADEKCEVEV